MSNLAHIVETAILLGVAYGSGAVIGFVLRRLTAVWMGRRPQSAAVPGEGQVRLSSVDSASSAASTSTSAPARAGISAAKTSEPERPAVAVPRLPARSVGSLFGSIEADLAGEAVIADTDARLALPGPQTIAPVPMAGLSAVEQLLAALAPDVQVPAEAAVEVAVEPDDAELAAGQTEVETSGTGAELAEPELAPELVITPADEQEQILAHEDDELAAMYAVEGTAPPRRRRQG